jgi:hypothetical protein
MNPPSFEIRRPVANAGHRTDTVTFGSFVNCAPALIETPTGPGGGAVLSVVDDVVSVVVDVVGGVPQTVVVVDVMSIVVDVVGGMFQSVVVVVEEVVEVGRVGVAPGFSNVVGKPASTSSAVK